MSIYDKNATLGYEVLALLEDVCLLEVATLTGLTALLHKVCEKYQIVKPTLTGAINELRLPEFLTNTQGFTDMAFLNISRVTWPL